MHSKSTRSRWSLVSAVQVVSFCAIIALALVMPLVPPARATDGWVTIVDYQFQPQDIYIQPGDTVTWQNNATSTYHTVTSDISSAEVFDSGQLAPGATFSHTFNTAGDFGYKCSNHPTLMTGTVHVGTVVPEFSSFAVVMIGLIVLMVGLMAVMRRR
jgi:plastocyanin